MSRRNLQEPYKRVFAGRL